MCGIFGLVRGTNPDPQAAARALATVMALGHKAEERGIDSAGIAAFAPSLGRRHAWTKPDAAHAGSTVTVIDDVIVIKDTTRFTQLPVLEQPDLLADMRVFLGHTRWATQGAADQRVNASPLLAGAIVGTHNGDVDATSVPGRKSAAAAAHGQTDTELVYLALHAARHDRSAMTKVLRTIHGRAALAFVDRSRPDRIYLARTALSPLSYAWTADGAFVYASNPDWFRQIEQDTAGAITFRNITLVPEGHLITVRTVTGAVEDVRRFTPTCREKDLHLINSAVYRKFTKEDKAAFHTLNRHKVASPRLVAWPNLTPAPTIEVASAVEAETCDAPAASEFDHDDINWAELENLCWALGDFDHHSFNAIHEASPVEAADMVEELRSQVAEAHKAGLTVPGWTFDAAEAA